MNDNILTALMQLSALVAQINQTHFHKNAHVLVKSYLEKMLGEKNIRVHLKQYFEFFNQYESEIENLVSKSNSANNLQVINQLCESLNKELTLADRYILMLSFLELIYIDKIITHEEQEFISALAVKFKISHEDFINACDFIFNIKPLHLNSTSYLVICDNEASFSEELEGTWITKNKPDQETYHIIHHKGLKDNIFILKFADPELLLLKYSGESSVYLTNRKVEQGKFYILNNFDQLLINNVPTSIYDINQKFNTERKTVPLIFKGKDVTIGSSKKIKAPDGKFSFCEEAGNIVALIGSNDTTTRFIRHISGRLLQKKQDICINGYNLSAEYYKIQKLIGYIPNYNIYNENISVYQNLYLTCKLSYPQFPETKIKAKVREIIEITKLIEVQHVIPAKNNELFEPLFQFLTNMAIELVHDPWLLFIEASFEKLSVPEYEIVLKILHSIASDGKLVFITSNHPNTMTFEYCNKLWIVDQQNYIIYNGNTHHVFDYFNQNSNNVLQIHEQCSFCGSVKPEIINQIIHQKTIDEKGEQTTKRKITPREWHKLYKDQIEPKIILKECKKVLPLHSGAIPTVSQQYFVHITQKLLSQKTKILNNLLELGIFTVCSIILAFLFRSDWSSDYLAGNNPNLHIFIIFSITLMLISGVIVAENENHKEKKQLAHDLKKNLSFFSYLNAQISWLIIISAIYSTIYSLITTMVLGIFEFFPKYLLIFFSLFVLGNIVGIWLSNIFTKRKVVYFALLALVVFNVLFNGITINIKSFPKPLSSEQYTPAITEASPLKWAFEALYVEHTINNDFEKLFYDYDKKIETSIFNANYLIPELQHKLLQISANPSGKENHKVLHAIQTEIKQFANNSEIFPFEYVDEMTSDKVKASIIKEASDYLTYIQLILSENIKKLTLDKHTLEHNLIDSIGNTGYLKFKKRYFNAYLFDLANKFNTAINVKFTNGDIIKNMNPLYLIPASNFGRAHLFAPVKMFNYLYYSTYWFNLFILWWFIFICFIIALISYSFSRIF
jgi:ABC-type multidrug transport system ATPase subunit